MAKSRTRTRIIALTAIVCVALVLAEVVRRLYDYHEREVLSMACLSHVSSLAACLEGDFARRTDIFVDRPDDWKQLAAEEYGNLAKALSKGYYGLDIGRRIDDANEVFLDAWQQRIVIAYRRTGNSKLTFIVWSKGPDGSFRNDDDIVHPFGVEMPEGLEE